MAEPQDISRSPNLQVTLLSWAEGGASLEPSSGRKDTGLIANDLLTSQELNWLSLEPMRWLRALFSRYLDASELLSSSWFVDKGTGIWSDDAVGILEGFLSDGPAGTASLAVDLWLDPNDTGAVRVQVNVPKAGPATFLANKDTYVFVPVDLIVPPTVSEPELTLLDVPVSDPAPATPAGTVLVWRVETDGAGIVDQEIFLSDFPVLKKVSFEELIADVLTIVGDLDVGGDLDVAGNTTLGDDPADTTTISGTLGVTGNSTIGVDATNIQQVHGDVTVGTDSTNTTTLEGDVTIGSASSNTPSIKGNLTIGSTNLSVHAVDGIMGFNDGLNGGVATPITLSEGAAVPASKQIALTGDAQVLGGAASKVTAGTLDTIDAAGAAKVGELQMYEDTPSSAAGVVQFDGRALAIGDGVKSNRLAVPLLDTVPTVSNAAALVDTGAATALNMRTGGDAKIVITATARNTVIGNNIVFIADAGGASIGNTTSFYEPIAIAGAVQPVTRIIRYTHAGADASVTFKARFGANAGTTHLTDVSIEASHI